MKYLLLFITFLLSNQLFAVDTDNAKIKLFKIQNKIKIDGKVDALWNQADSVVLFFQQDPYYGQPPTQTTIAKVLSTDESLYCLMICYDNTGKIEANSGVLDQFTGDVVSIMLDTYNDKRTAYKFAVNASGVKMDSRMMDDGRNRDYSWDGVWFAATEVHDWGYIVEMEIPYKSISYDKNLNEWGLDFDRWIPRNAEDLYWRKYEQSEGLRISKFGKLVLDDLAPKSTGLNLEVYPVGLANATLNEDGSYNTDANAGLDIFYNPSPNLTYQLTVNPDFAQIEADPYDFNISRYESYFNERRPFFTQGNEVFTASGRERGSGFYSPLELFYSRRIGKKLPDGSEVPLIAGTKAFGRSGEWEYGGFMALTGEKDFYDEDDEITKTENSASFGVARIKKQIMGNSTIGILFAGKHDRDNNYGVLDIDGAFRGSSWQLAYQLARSFEGNQGDYAASSGFRYFTNKWAVLAKGRYVGENFDINQIGFVPWLGTMQFTALTGPIKQFETGYLKTLMLYGGTELAYEKEDDYTDKFAILGINMNFRNNWGYEINLNGGKAKDENIEYDAYGFNLSSWFHISPRWSANFYGGMSHSYNFDKEFLANNEWIGTRFSWIASKSINFGTSADAWIEQNPEGSIEDVTYNARPYINVIPFNNLNIQLYVDNVYLRSSDKLENIIGGLLVSYNFAPKSWIYFALNEVRSRDEIYNERNVLISNKLRTTDRASVFKIKYLLYL